MTAPFRLMGVLNVTPDSFSDGGEWFDGEAAVAHGRELVGEGADIIDIGGESTRPGAEPVSADEELRRVVPAIAALAAATPETTLSIDTTKSSVACAALDAGATYVNDVSALRADPELATLIADRGAHCCLMHMQGEPRTMQNAPQYDDVVADVKAFLEQRLTAAVEAGIPENDIDLDPGIGFGKTAEHNLELLRRLDEIVALGRPVVVGVSRKTFLGTITGHAVPARRAVATAAANVLALERGATVFRVHDVAVSRDALRTAAAILRGHHG